MAEICKALLIARLAGRSETDCAHHQLLVVALLLRHEATRPVAAAEGRCGWRWSIPFGVALTATWCAVVARCWSHFPSTARQVAAARWWWTLFSSSASAQEWKWAGVAAARKVAAARWWWTLFPSSSSAQEWRRAGVAAARKVAAARRRRRWRRRTLFPSASAQKGERTDVAAAEGW